MLSFIVLFFVFQFGEVVHVFESFLLVFLSQSSILFNFDTVFIASIL